VLPEGIGIPKSGNVFLFQPESSTVKRHTVALGGIGGNSAIVKDGLKAGDHVVTAGASFLYDGQKVKAVLEQAPASSGSAVSMPVVTESGSGVKP
jgi:multidrug efflux pump subunit AcrA (membrane-fusion protein)